jgi:hypothetical protein
MFTFQLTLVPNFLAILYNKATHLGRSTTSYVLATTDDFLSLTNANISIIISSLFIKLAKPGQPQYFSPSLRSPYSDRESDERRRGWKLVTHW